MEIVKIGKKTWENCYTLPNLTKVLTVKVFIVQ